MCSAARVCFESWLLGMMLVEPWIVTNLRSSLCVQSAIVRYTQRICLVHGGLKGTGFIPYFDSGFRVVEELILRRRVRGSARTSNPACC